VPDRLWKAAERAIAAKLGGVRVPVSGRSRGDAPDVAHDLLSIEVKTRQTLPAWLGEALSQATAAARTGQIPTVILHQTGQRYDGALCLLRLADLAALLKLPPDAPR